MKHSSRTLAQLAPPHHLNSRQTRPLSPNHRCSCSEDGNTQSSGSPVVTPSGSKHVSNRNGGSRYILVVPLASACTFQAVLPACVTFSPVNFFKILLHWTCNLFPSLSRLWTDGTELSSNLLGWPLIFFSSIMYFPKAAAVFLCVTALSEAFSIPDVEYHLAARTPQKFGQGGGRNRANNGAAKASNGAVNSKISTTAATPATATTAATAAASVATGNNNKNNKNNNNVAAGNGAAGTACLKSNAVQTGQ